VVAVDLPVGVNLWSGINTGTWVRSSTSAAGCTIESSADGAVVGEVGVGTAFFGVAQLNKIKISPALSKILTRKMVSICVRSESWAPTIDTCVVSMLVEQQESPFPSITQDVQASPRKL
jgi:hypothetical protein